MYRSWLLALLLLVSLPARAGLIIDNYAYAVAGGGPDTSPDAFDFTDQGDVATSTSTSSNIVQITGIDTASAVTISGDGSPQFRICSTSNCSSEVVTWGSSSQDIDNLEYLQLRLTSNASAYTANTATVNVGTANADWVVTTRPNGPYVRAVGSSNTGTGAVGVPLPVGHTSGDLLVIFAESENEDISMTTGGWTQIDVAQGSGTAADNTSVRLEAFYKIDGGSEGVPTVADSGDHTHAIMIAFANVNTSAPINAATGNTGASSTSVSFPSVTTSVANCLIVNAIAGSEDTSQDQASGWANSDLINVQERADDYVGTAGGGGISVGTGTLTSATASDITSATLANASLQARLTFAIAPP